MSEEMEKMEKKVGKNFQKFVYTQNLRIFINYKQKSFWILKLSLEMRLKNITYRMLLLIRNINYGFIFILSHSHSMFLNF